MRARIAAELPLKIALSLGLTFFFCVPYFGLQQAPVFEVRTLPLTPIDHAVGFSPGWAWIYQSVYLLVAMVPWLATDRGSLVRYAKGFVLLSTVGFLFFLFVPVAGPRPVAVETGGMYALLVAYDSPLNSFPSLHCGLAAYTVLLAGELSRRLAWKPRAWHPASAPCRRASRVSSKAGRHVVISALWAWMLLVCYATLATRQHYFVDLPPAILLAWICHRWAWRGAAATVAHVPAWSRQVTRA